MKVPLQHQSYGVSESHSESIVEVDSNLYKDTRISRMGLIALSDSAVLESLQ